MSVTSRRKYFEDSFINREQRHIERTTTKIVDNNLRLFALLIQSVGNGGSGRLVDNAEDVQASDDTCIFSGLTLVVVEVCWDGNNRVGDLFAQVCLRNLLHFTQNHGGEFFRREDPLLSRQLVTAP